MTTTDLDARERAAQTRPEPEPCPTWCAAEHTPTAQLEDNAHTANSADVPVIIAAQPPFRYGDDATQAAEFVVAMRKYCGHREIWVYIGDGEDTSRGFDLTRESARRLARAIAEVVG